MDLQKLKIWQTGMTPEERDALEKKESAETQWKEKKGLVAHTMKTQGFNIILKKIVAQTEVKKLSLLRCKEKDLARLQLEIEIRKEFLHSFNEFVD